MTEAIQALWDAVNFGRFLRLLRFYATVAGVSLAAMAIVVGGALFWGLLP